MSTPTRTPVVKFGDVYLGGSTTYDWEFRSGSAPVERTFVVSAARADACAQYLGTPQTLTIEGPRATLTVHNLYLLEIQPGADPYTKRLRVADRRWLWPKRWAMAVLNLRRTNGNRFLAGEGRIENKLVQPQIRYARFSLYPPENPGDVWKIRDALTWLIRDVLETPVVFDDEPVDIEIQDVDLDDSGAAAVDRLLSHVPGLDIFIDAEGTAHVYDVFSGREAELRDKLPPLHRDGGWVDVIDKRALRPSKVVVLYTPEAEMRVDYTEPSSGVSRTRREDEPTLTNVGPTTDAETLIDGQVLARSSWADLEKQFAAWGPFGVHGQAITFDLLRKYALKHGWANFEQAWGNNPLVPPDSVNLARAAMTAQTWRRVFRLDRYWVQRLHSIRAYRTAIVNYETGAYAPATVYSDWIRRPSYKGLASKNDPNVSHGWAVRGYPSSGLLADAEPAPARVDVLDQQAGIIAITPQVDPYGLSQAMLLGYPEKGAIPSQVLGDANRTGQEVYARWDQLVLEGGWRLSVVLTVVPASPNNIDRAYKVEVTPDQIEPALGPCEGPPVYVRVFPGVMTARFAWSDGDADALRAAIKGEGPWPDHLLVNPEFVQDVALAAAKRAYDPLRDRPTGQPSFDLAPTLYPAGTVSAVRHTMASGECTTSLVFGSVTQAVDLNRYMSASTRKAVNMILNDRRA